MTSLDFAAMMREERRRRQEAAQAAAAPQRPLLADRQRLNLEAFRIGKLQEVEDCFYVPEFLSVEEATALQEGAMALGGSSWSSLPGRRLLNLGGVPHSSGMFVEPLPRFAAALASALAQAGAFEEVPDQFLINEYFEAQGIDPHRDGPLYRPKAAIVSLGSPAMLDFFTAVGPAPGDRKIAEPVSEGMLLRRVASVVLEPRSLLIFSGAAYTKLFHGISSGAEMEEMNNLCINRERVSVGNSWRRGNRISFTVRKAALVSERPATAEGEAEARRRHSHWLRSVADKR